MDNFLTLLRKHFPVLFSPRFWGIVGTAVFGLAKAKGWIDEATAGTLRDIFGFGTAVGVTDKAIKQIKASVPPAEATS